jgi:hypothetical protein
MMGVQKVRMGRQAWQRRVSAILADQAWRRSGFRQVV